jgi:hypothetical protein
MYSISTPSGDGPLASGPLLYIASFIVHVVENKESRSVHVFDVNILEAVIRLANLSGLGLLGSELAATGRPTGNATLWSRFR